MAGVDTVVGRGYVDTKNMFVYGCSGGGVLTACTVGHTDRFAAAASLCPVINWLSFVGETPPIPEAGICARPGLPPDVIARVKAALLAMKGPEHAAVLKNIYNIDGFEEAADADYDPVRDAVSLMGLARPK